MNIQKKKSYSGLLKKGEIAGHDLWMSLGLEDENIVIGFSFKSGRIVTDCGRSYCFFDDETFFAYTIEDENNDCRKK